MGKTVEAYIDDMVVKSKQNGHHLKHLREVFNVLRRYRMRLNPIKCSFGVGSGQFLGHVVNNRGIEISPTQAEALLNNTELCTIKEVQALTGRIAALSRFISKLSDRYKPFFDIIISHGKQCWGNKQRQALNNLKEYMRNPPVLNAPNPGEKLFLYLGVFSVSTSGVLIRCAEAIKGQAVADFLLECDVEEPEAYSEESSWKLFVDGSSNQIGVGIGIKLQTPDGTALSQAVKLEFRATNNEAEYEALLAGLRLAKELKVRNLVAFSDSQLIIRQVTGEYSTKDETMEEYRSAVIHKAKNFNKIKFTQVPREHNADVDRLAYSASSSGETLARVIPVGVLRQPSILEQSTSSDSWQVNVIPYEPSWIDPIMAYIRDGVLPEQRDEARRVRSNAAKYAVVHDQLYRRSYLGPYLKCVTPAEAQQILRTIHEGVCGNHSAGDP
ncbi:uncharacterized protein LOC132273041 [Cornus florida]|uniref:uncharacterized protein LOC132273041 n=1 Tax=Cornus florida TaxID=4283 RepID=UPI00289ABD84|nr:uncharacterized protein LOC132273041 [Cornus florida]